MGTSPRRLALVASVGGPRGIREATPLVDRVEIKASARATRVGHLDFEIMATVSEDEVRTNAERVRSISESVPMGIFILTRAGTGPGVAGLKQNFGDGYLARFVGEPEAVADALRGLGELGIDRIQLTEMFPGSHSALAPHLLS